MKKHQTAAVKTPRPPIRPRTREAIGGYLFMAPWIVGFFAFTLFPFLYSIYLSFQEVNLQSGGGIRGTFVGLRWYKEALTEDTTFTLSLLDSLKFIVLSTPMIVVVALLLALLLNGKYRGRTLFRAIFFFPVVIVSGPVVDELMQTNAAAVVHPENYLIYDFIQSLPGVLSSPLLYIFDNIVMILWFSGVQIILFLAGLQKIGQPLREAASIDGASSWQMFWKIYLPFLKPLLLLNTIYTIVMLSAFSDNAVNGEIVGKMYATGKEFAYSSAMAWIYFLILLILLGVAFLLFRGRKETRHG